MWKTTINWRAASGPLSGSVEGISETSGDVSLSVAGMKLGIVFHEVVKEGACVDLSSLLITTEEVG